ncbi:hypothetical protein BDQ17DRAFT_1425113 [Cyathus striatus]|nr:hypothetical protein BDQ17DRAFT_1425113 [Cyathus striatus]
MAEDNCALNQDGSLKDASQIQWYFDPDDKVSQNQIPQPWWKKTKRAKVVMFLDLEAQVASSSEDENDEEEPNEFIVDSKENDNEDPNIPYVVSRRDAHSHAGPSSTTIISKYNVAYHSRVARDWSLYDIPVKNRLEEQIVYQLNLHAGPKHIRSAFALSIIPGHVYVEALNLEDLKKFTKIFGDINQFHIHPAPNIMWDSYFGNVGTSYTPYKHTWVKVVLQGIVSLAFVEDITEENVMIRLFHSPDVLFKYPLNLLEKCFKIGNGVKVKSGEHKGVVSIVTNVEACGCVGEENITIVAFLLKKGKHVPVCSSDLDFCSKVHRNSTFRWEDSNDTSTPDASGSWTIEDRLMCNDLYQLLYGLYGVVTSSPQKGDIGILKCVNTNGHAELEVEAHLINHPSWNICLTPAWENDSGIGSQTPAWDPNSRTPQISNVVSAKELVYPHRIPENIASMSALQASAPLPDSMRTAVIGEGSSACDTSADAFNSHWINQLLEADSTFLDCRYLHVVISGSLPTAASSGFKRGRYEKCSGTYLGLMRSNRSIWVEITGGQELEVPAEYVHPEAPSRKGEHVMIINRRNYQLYREVFMVLGLMEQEIEVCPVKEQNRAKKMHVVPAQDLGVFVEKLF